MSTEKLLENPFTPSFGEVPYSMVGRRDDLRRIVRALEARRRDPYLSCVITGARGTGKTALLTYVAQQAEERGWLAVSTYASPDMLEEIYEDACMRASHLVDAGGSARVTSVSAGPMGVGWEYPTSSAGSWNTRITQLVEELSSREVGLLITVDEVRPDLDEVVKLVGTYQLLVRRNLKVALLVAGLPHQVSLLLNHESTSFLRRSMPMRLGSVADYDAEVAFRQTVASSGKEISPEALSLAIQAAEGFPFMIQLVGYRIWECGEDHDVLSEQDGRDGVDIARREFEDRIVAPSYYELSDGDRRFLQAMLADERESTLADIAHRLGRGNSFAAQYKRRLLEAGVIEESWDKSLHFALPGLRPFASAQGT